MKFILGIFICFLVISTCLDAEETTVSSKPPLSSFSLPPEGLSLSIDQNRVRFDFRTDQGIQLKGLLDTGADYSVIKSTSLSFFTYEELDTSLPISTVNNSAQSTDQAFINSNQKLVRLKNVAISPGALSDLIAVIIDPSKAGNGLDLGPFDLILGVEPLIGKTVILDFKNQRLSQYNFSDLPQDFTWFDFGYHLKNPSAAEVWEFKPFVLATSNGQSFQVLLDTGFTGASRGFNFSGESTARNFTQYTVPVFPELTLGKLLIDSRVQGYVRPSPQKLSFYGLPGMAKRNWIFDFQKRRVGVLPKNN